MGLKGHTISVHVILGLRIVGTWKTEQTLIIPTSWILRKEPHV